MLLITPGERIAHLRRNMYKPSIYKQRLVDINIIKIIANIDIIELEGNMIVDIAPHELKRAVKLLWLLNPHLQKLRHTSESSLITEIYLK